MNGSIRHVAVGLAVLGLLGAGTAGAQTPAPPPAGEVRGPDAAPLAPESRGTGAPTRMRSSHTVDVIAPGEKVDTILGRMRPERPAPSPREDAVRPPPGPESPGGRPAPGAHRTEQSRPLDNGRDNGRETGRPPPPPSPRTDGVAPPPSSPRPPPPR